MQCNEASLIHTQINTHTTVNTNTMVNRHTTVNRHTDQGQSQTKICRHKHTPDEREMSNAMQ